MDDKVKNHMKLNGVMILLEQYDQCKDDREKLDGGDLENRLKHASAASIHRGLYIQLVSIIRTRKKKNKVTEREDQKKSKHTAALHSYRYGFLAQCARSEIRST